MEHVLNTAFKLRIIENGHLIRTFEPPHPNARPSDLFIEAESRGTPTTPVRFTRRDDAGTMLAFISGACINNGGHLPRAGWSVVLNESHTMKGRIEKPPSGQQETSERAELRAALAVIERNLRFWPGEGFTRLVIASDSEYVVKNITQRVPTWLMNNWRNHSDTAVTNQDLWKKLAEELAYWDTKGLLVQFWQIPKELNRIAHEQAVLGAQVTEQKAEIQETIMI